LTIRRTIAKNGLMNEAKARPAGIISETHNSVLQSDIATLANN
jgi:hypothetical protein